MSEMSTLTQKTKNNNKNANNNENYKSMVSNGDKSNDNTKCDKFGNNVATNFY